MTSINLKTEGADNRSDVWMVNARDRMVQVTAAHADIMLKAKKGRRATQREIEAYQQKVKGKGKAQVSGASHALLNEVRALAEDSAAARAPSAEDEVGEAGITRAEAITALKPYDTKAKLIGLAAQHEVAGLTDKMTVADLKDALASAVMSGAIAYEAL